jgi:hypothetical protein
MPFDVASVRSWKIYRDFKQWSSSLSDRTVAALSISAIALVGIVTFLARVPKRQPKLPALPKKDRKIFIPSRDWKPVDDDHICPPGLEYRIDLETGSKLARKPDPSQLVR